MRAITLLLAIVMMTGALGQVCASSDATGAVAVVAVDDADGPDLDTPILPAPVAAPLPGLQEPVCIEAPAARARGRMHAVIVFRPPRLVTSR